MPVKCLHDSIMTFYLEGTLEPVMWACRDCRHKFVPMSQLLEEVAEEREACATVCDEYEDGRYANCADLCAASIRSRK